MVRIEGSMRLVDVPIETWVQVTVLTGREAVRVKLAQHGLYPGDRLRVVRTAPLGGPLLVEVNGRALAIGRGVAESIMVQEL
jgi:ferrous iron transport protein A